MPEPIYLAESIRCAFQLLWSVSVFWKAPGPGTQWLPALKQSCDAAGIRITEHRLANLTSSLLLVSTRPDLPPLETVRGIKGRLAPLMRQHRPNPFRRNFDLQSVGSTKREKIESYAAGQVEHHTPDGVRPDINLTDLQLIDPDVDLAQPQFTSHGRYRCNLHIVLRLKPEFVTQDSGQLLTIRRVVRMTVAKHEFRLSRLGLLNDHLHLVLGMRPTIAPLDVVFVLLNNLAWNMGKVPAFVPGCFVGTVGEYDLGAIQPGDITEQ